MDRPEVPCQSSLALFRAPLVKLSFDVVVLGFATEDSMTDLTGSAAILLDTPAGLKPEDGAMMCCNPEMGTCESSLWEFFGREPETRREINSQN